MMRSLAARLPHRPRLGRREWLRIGLVALSGAALLGVLVFRVATATRAVTKAPAHTLIGQMAPDLAVTVWNGSPSQTLDLAALRGQPVVLNFWGSWCDPCHAESPLLVAAWQRYHPHGVAFVGAAMDTPRSDGLTFLAQEHIPYAAGAVPTEEAAVAYGLLDLPDTIFIDRQGRVATKIVGQLKPDELDAAIQALLR